MENHHSERDHIEQSSPEDNPSISRPPAQKNSTVLLATLLIIGIIVLGIITAVIVYKTRGITNKSAVTTESSTPNLARQDSRISPADRDEQRLDDIAMLLTAIKKYKEEGEGNGTYYPRNLVSVVPQEHKARIYELRQTAQYGYQQSKDGTNFYLQIPMETSTAHNTYAKDSVGRNVLRFSQASEAYIDISLD